MDTNEERQNLINIYLSNLQRMDNQIYIAQTIKGLKRNEIWHTPQIDKLFIKYKFNLQTSPEELYYVFYRCPIVNDFEKSLNLIKTTYNFDNRYYIIINLDGCYNIKVKLIYVYFYNYAYMFRFDCDDNYEHFQTKVSKKYNIDMDIYREPILPEEDNLTFDYVVEDLPCNEINKSQREINLQNKNNRLNVIPNNYLCDNYFLDLIKKTYFKKLHKISYNYFSEYNYDNMFEQLNQNYNTIINGSYSYINDMCYLITEESIKTIEKVFYNDKDKIAEYLKFKNIMHSSMDNNYDGDKKLNHENIIDVINNIFLELNRTKNLREQINKIDLETKKINDIVVNIHVDVNDVYKRFVKTYIYFLGNNQILKYRYDYDYIYTFVEKLSYNDDDNDNDKDTRIILCNIIFV